MNPLDALAPIGLAAGLAAFIGTLFSRSRVREKSDKEEPGEKSDKEEPGEKSDKEDPGEKSDTSESGRL